MRLFFFFPLIIWNASVSAGLYRLSARNAVDQNSVQLFFLFFFPFLSPLPSQVLLLSFLGFFTIQINDRRVQRAALRFGGALSTAALRHKSLSLSLSQEKKKTLCFFFFLLFRLTSFWRSCYYYSFVFFSSSDISKSKQQ